MKKAIVDYDGENPIAVREVRDFKDEASFKAYEELCKVNKAKKEKADEEAVAVAVAREAEEKRKDNVRWAWVALLWVESELERGACALTDEEYNAMVENFNLGEIKDLDTMPTTFKTIYERLRRE